MDEREFLHEIEVPLLAPSVNGYWRMKRGGGRYITPAGTIFRMRVIQANKGFRVDAQAVLGVEMDLYSEKWRTKQGGISRTAGDIDNFCKGSLDSLFSAIGGDDSQVVELRVRKLMGTARTVFRVFRFMSGWLER